MPQKKKVLVAGATGLVGHAAMKHFAAEGCETVALSRRKPDETFGARWHALDLTDAAACAALASAFEGTTHFVYAALHERPGLVAGWREDEQIRTNDAMFRNLFDVVERAVQIVRRRVAVGDVLAREFPPEPAAFHVRHVPHQAEQRQ